MTVSVLPRVDGAPLQLATSLAMWRRLEREFCPPAPGPGLGALYLEHKLMRLRLDVTLAIIHAAAQVVDTRVEFTDVERHVLTVGLVHAHTIVDELFEDLFRARRPAAPAEEGAPAGVPLAGGGSTPTST